MLNWISLDKKKLLACKENGELASIRHCKRLAFEDCRNIIFPLQLMIGHSKSYIHAKKKLYTDSVVQCEFNPGKNLMSTPISKREGKKDEGLSQQMCKPSVAELETENRNGSYQKHECTP